jgi:hypothetical protein
MHGAAACAEEMIVRIWIIWSLATLRCHRLNQFRGWETLPRDRRLMMMIEGLWSAGAAVD